MEVIRLMKNQRKLICPYGASIHYQLLITRYCDLPLCCFWASAVSLWGNVYPYVRRSLGSYSDEIHCPVPSIHALRDGKPKSVSQSIKMNGARFTTCRAWMFDSPSVHHPPDPCP
jgi:hypothetical protein